MSNPTTDFMEGNGGVSDSDTNSEDSPEYYQPISAMGSDDEGSDQVNSDEDHEVQASDFHRLPNGSWGHIAENGVSPLHLNDDVEEEHEEERIIEASDSAIRRAFREDESRRNAPLTPENTMRVMEAMRGVSFGGLTPDWAGHVPEDQWIDQLRRLRPSSESSTTIRD